MSATARDFAYWVHQDTQVFMTYVPDRAMHFIPMLLSDYIILHTPNAPIGAIHQYVWTAAYAKSEAVMKQAVRNLIGLLPDDARYFGETLMDECSE